MRLGCKIDNGHGPVPLQQVFDKFDIAYVAVNKYVARAVCDARETIEVARIGELIETNDRGEVETKPIENEICPDKSRRARHQDGFFERACAADRSNRSHFKSS